MIVDGFIFYNELDILKIRLEELYPVVDRFVLVESDKTFRGKRKPYIFDDNKGMFEQYLDKISHIKLVDDNSFNTTWQQEPWKREEWQRNQIARGLEDLSPEDIVIISDVDEVPRREVIESLDINEPMTLTMEMYYYGINVHAGTWGGAKTLRLKDFTTAEQTRHSVTKDSIANAGWHFSYLGDVDHIINKLQSFSHWELDTPEITDRTKMLERMKDGIDIWGRGTKYDFVTVDDTYPVEIRANLDYYQRYVY